MEADDPPNSLQWMRNGHRRRSSKLQQDIASYKATYQLLHAPRLEYLKKLVQRPLKRPFMHVELQYVTQNYVKGWQGNAKVFTTTFVTCKF
jgi:hypothetical protein